MKSTSSIPSNDAGIITASELFSNFSQVFYISSITIFFDFKGKKVKEITITSNVNSFFLDSMDISFNFV